jgi:hypothetical protein
VLSVQGNNLSLSQGANLFPVALLNNQACQVLRAGENELSLQVHPGLLRSGSNQLAIALDPYAVITMELLEGQDRWPDREPYSSWETNYG